MVGHQCNPRLSLAGNLLSQLEEIDDVMRGHHGHWEYSRGLNFLYQTIFEQSADDFLALVKLHFEKDSSLSLDKLQVVKTLLELLTAQEVLNLIEQHSLTDKTLWLLLVFVALPEEKCTSEHSGQIIQLYKQGDVLQYGVGLDYLIKFRPYNNQIIEDVVAILVDKSDEGNFPWHALSSLFGFGAGDSELLEGSFLDNFDLLKKAYFLQLERSNGGIYHHPRDLNMLLDRDPHFMLECVNYVFEKEEYPSRHTDSSDYSFLWKKEGYKSLIEELFMHAYSLEPESWREPYICSFFKIKSETDNLVKERQDLFLEMMLEKHQADSSIIEYIFRVVENFSDERKIQHIKAMLKLKPSIDIFKKIRLLPSGHSWSGSLIPILRKEIEFLEEVKSSLNGINFLEHKAHVEELISYQRRRISSQEKREFLEDF